MSGLSVMLAAALCFLRIDVTQGQYTACFRGDNPLCVCTLTPESQFEVDCSFKNIMAAIDGIPNTTVSLDLSGNMLHDIPLGFLRNLSVLKLLNVENNALVVLRNDSFAGLRNLTSLFLGGNDLIDIEKDAFKSVSHLQQLRLNNNKLTIITNGTFDGLTSLNSLNLASNQLENIEPHVFLGLQSLKYLDLSYNKLSTLKESVFALSMVSYLDLSYNRFADVPCKVLPTKTVTLKLSHNVISDIPSNCFEKLEELRSVWIDGNTIKTLSCDTFPSLLELQVSGNPWHCDCSLVHAKICLGHSLQDTLVCRHPLLYSGVDIEEFSDQMFDNCSISTASVTSTELEQTSFLSFTENPRGALSSTVKFINVTSEDCDKNCLKTKYVGLVVLVGVGCSVITLISTCIFFFLCIRNKSKKKQRRRSKLNSDSNETSGNRISEMIPMISVAEAPSGDHHRDYNQEQETFLGTFQKKNSKPQKDQPSAAVQEKNSSEGYAHPQPAMVPSDQGQATRSMTPDNHYMRVTIDFDSNDAINL